MKSWKCDHLNESYCAYHNLERPTPYPHLISHSCSSLTRIAMPHPSPVSHSPFEPQTAIVRGLLDLCSSRRQAFPAWSRITESSLRITACNKQYHTPYNNWQIHHFYLPNQFCIVMMYVVLSFESVNTLWCDHFTFDFQMYLWPSANLS